MRCLITGGAGFIGSHLAEALLARGDTVTALDNLSTGTRENVRHLEGNPRFRFVVGDVLDPETVAALMSRCDVVFHLAAAVGVKRIIDHPLASIQNNLRGTEVVLEQADRFGKKVLLASTSEVYGKNGHGPLHEDSDRVIGSTTITRWLYATTKACDEFMALAYHRERKLPVVILRFFNTVGPRQTGQYGMVVPRFVQQALLGEPITIYGDGKQTRCFTDVADTVRCVVALADNPRAEGRVFNIGNGREISIEELARQVIAITRSSSPIVYIPYEEAYEAGFEDMRRRVPNTDRLRETIGFAPGIPFEQTLRRIISHFELTLPAPVAPAVGEDVLPPRLHPEAALAAVG
jgi:UDP-glucose 4-epimerase